jgi:hypothetical protein
MIAECAAEKPPRAFEISARLPKSDGGYALAEGASAFDGGPPGENSDRVQDFSVGAE